MPGEGVAHQGGETPPCLQGARLPGLSAQGTLNDCWRAWPASASRCTRASQVCPLMKRSTRVLVSTSAFPCWSFCSTWEAPPSGSLCVCDLDRPPLCRMWGLPPRLTPPGHHVRGPHWAVFQPGCQPLELKSSLLFKACFLALGPA